MQYYEQFKEKEIINILYNFWYLIYFVCYMIFYQFDMYGILLHELMSKTGLGIKIDALMNNHKRRIAF